MDYYCKEKGCNNKVCYHTWKHGKGRCHFCESKGKNNSMYGKKGKIMSTLWKISYRRD